MNSNTLKILIFFILFLFAAPAYCENLIPHFWPIKTISGLEINTQNTYKGRVNKCEKEGIGDIYALNSPFEEFWAFIPSKCIWIELGILEKVGNSIRRDQFGHCHPPNTISGIKKIDVIALIKRFEYLTLYHPHPPNRLLVEHVAKYKGLGDYTETCIKEARTETLESALPSLPDLSSMLEFSRILFQYHPNGKFAEKIISSYGETEYYLTPIGYSELEHGRFEIIRRKAMRTYLRLRKRIQKIHYKEDKSPKRNVEKLEALQKMITSEIKIFSISFIPKKL